MEEVIEVYVGGAANHEQVSIIHVDYSRHNKQDARPGATEGGHMTKSLISLQHQGTNS
jgi:hypothetical protein